MPVVPKYAFKSAAEPVKVFVIAVPPKVIPVTVFAVIVPSAMARVTVRGVPSTSAKGEPVNSKLPEASSVKVRAAGTPLAPEIIVGAVLKGATATDALDALLFPMALVALTVKV